ncbi:MAG: hypothetical protein JXA30_14760 [Deltaproteobacteria bacterium]|nr:hypothetical protein [Deltaproteobacteria bacterium]
MAVRFRVSTGEEGEARAFSDPILTLICERAFPPGRPITMTLYTDRGQLALQAKTIGSRREIEQRYEVRVRMINLRRMERDLLQTLFLV